MGTAKKVGGPGDEEGSVMKDFWRNDYDRICQENADRLDGVSVKNRIALIRMFQYVAAFPVSLFQLEVVKKDLIGLASEADMEK